MDAGRFDALTRSLPAGTRRRAITVALGGLVGLLGLGRPDVSGHDALKACKGKKGDKEKCLKKAKKHNAQHQTEPEPDCQNDGDCTDQIELCDGGVCKPACPSANCDSCNLCVVHLQSGSDRERVCAFTLFPVAPDSCSTDVDCAGDDVCVRISTGSCTQSPCGFCVSPINVCQP